MTAPLTSACHTKQPLGCRARRCGPSATTVAVPAPALPAGPNLLRYPVHQLDGETAARSNHGGHGLSLASPAVSGPRDSLRAASAVRRPVEKSISVGAARLPQIGGLSVGYLSLKPPDCVSPVESPNQKYNS